MSYASEVGGYHHGSYIETVHTDYLKSVHSGRKTTAHNMIYTELGRMSLSLHREIRMIKYWCKLLNAKNCILKACYDQLYKDCEKGKNNWANNKNTVM